MRKVYLNNVTRKDAQEKFLTLTALNEKTEKVKVADATGLTTAEAVFARLSMPGHHAAAMDGITVSAKKTFGASDQNPLVLKKESDFSYIDTGNPLPDNCDAVIKIEDIHVQKEGDIEIMQGAVPWQHIRSVGEDVVNGEMILPSYHRLRPQDLGALMAGGITEIKVLSKPKFAIIPTGSEIVEPEAARAKGAIPDFNSSVIRAYLREWGAEGLIFPIVPDEPLKIKEMVTEAIEKADAVIVIAGSSAGRKDYTAHVIEELGEVFLHGVATRPGKPTILGSVKGKPAIGLPGYPVSAYLSLEWFALPLICRYFKEELPAREKLKVTLGRRVVSDIGTEEHVRMTVGYINGNYIANPLTRGAGVTTSLVRADGLLIIPAESVGHEQESEAEIELYRPAALLKNNLLAAGSHDLILDLIANALKEKNTLYSLSSAHLGSMGGINAIAKGQAHLAGIHLFHPESGDYNTPYIERYISGSDVILMTLAHRMQGWMVPDGNPDDISEILDLMRKNIEFVNRQRGAGTRLLFDYLLKEAGLKAANIYGYEREEHTHLNVAAAIAAGTARAGLGILPAARAFSLDFVPVAEERYDLLMTREFANSKAGKTLSEVITDPSFREKVESMGGYSLREAGMVRG